MTLTIPLEMINQVSEERCEWLVPGLLRERVIALLRGLPKSLRRSFVPVPDYADACLKDLKPADRPLTRALGERLRERTGVYVPEDAWDPETLPEHLRMNFRLLDEQGRACASGRDLVVLRQRYGGKGEARFAVVSQSELERDGLRDWGFGALPETVRLERGGINLRGYPAILDQGDSVSLRVLDSAQAAERATRAGLRRLLMLRLGREVRYLGRSLPNLQRMRLQYAKAPGPPEGRAEGEEADLADELTALIIQVTFLQDRPPIRDAETFNARLDGERGRLVTVANDTGALVAEVLERYQRLRKALADTTQTLWQPSIQDMREQLDRLVYRGFLDQTPYAMLQQLPRYLRGIEMRLDKLTTAAQRDRQRMAEMAPLFDQWREREEQVRRQGKRDERIEELRWTFEELRISFFAQELKTAYPVSLKRVEKRWKDLGL